MMRLLPWDYGVRNLGRSPLRLLLSLAGAALAVLRWGQFSISNEGLSVHMTASAGVIVTGWIVSSMLGVLAGLVPAVQASRREITTCFRAV